MIFSFQWRSNSYAGALHPQERRLCDGDHAPVTAAPAETATGEIPY
jgi:hypothetical protein